MITGSVNGIGQATIKLVARGFARQELEVEAIIDTGYNGNLTLPSEIIKMLDFAWRRSGLALLADGSEVTFDIYEGMVLWDGEMRRVAVDESNSEPLVGMSLMRGYELRIQVKEDGTVTIRSME